MLGRIKKDDLVVVIAGKDKGKQGHVISIDHPNGKVMVKDVCIVTRHLKAKRQGEKSRISKEESFLPLCKVMPICPSCKKPCRIQVKVSGETKSRACHLCKEAF